MTIADANAECVKKTGFFRKHRKKGAGRVGDLDLNFQKRAEKDAYLQRRRKKEGGREADKSHCMTELET